MLLEQCRPGPWDVVNHPGRQEGEAAATPRQALNEEIIQTSSNHSCTGQLVQSQEVCGGVALTPRLGSTAATTRVSALAFGLVPAGRTPLPMAPTGMDPRRYSYRLPVPSAGWDR